MSEKEPPTIVIFAGPNGAGKTTFSEEWLGNQDLVTVFINADEFARDLDPELPKNKRDRQAAKLFLKAMKDLVAKRKSFALETTLATLSYQKHILTGNRLVIASSLFISHWQMLRHLLSG